MLTYAVLITLSSFVAAVWPDRQARAVEKRITQGGDRFFEEQRSYQAYPILRDRRYIRRMGIFGTLAGLTLCAVQMFRG
jgi:hypothetical protein